MSNKEVIQGWKSGDAPENPAGDVSLSEEELEAVAGGDENSVMDCTSSGSICKGTCCFPPLNMGCCEQQ